MKTNVTHRKGSMVYFISCTSGLEGGMNYDVRSGRITKVNRDGTFDAGIYTRLKPGCIYATHQEAESHHLHLLTK